MGRTKPYPALGVEEARQLMAYQISLPAKWLDAASFEKTLNASGVGPHAQRGGKVVFHFPTNCSVMIDAALRLLSLINQLDRCSISVRLEFDEGEAGTMGYLNRIGFFDHLSSAVEVCPPRPSISGAQLFRGQNAKLVEIAPINRSARDNALPTKLTDALINACSARSDADELEGAAWTIFAELIDNVFSHSETGLDGYASLQVYQKGNGIKVAVSDSGLGIMDTLRPALKREASPLCDLPDLDLLVEIFRQGISRHGATRGCGLKGSAAKAIKFNADLDIRLPTIRVLLSPGIEGYKPNVAYCYEHLPLIWGTHICFNFRLDTKPNSR